MKYQHDFAVKHLPKVVIGSIILFVAFVLYTMVIANLIMGTENFITFLYALFAVGFNAAGGLVMTDGIRYDSYPKPEPVDPPVTRKETVYKTIDQRREEVLAMDFGPHDNDVKLAERAKKEALKKELLT